jgi:hypothetical protein
MIKMKHLRHPLRTANAVRGRVAAYLDRKRFVDRGERRFRGDARYNLRNVTNGFVSRIDDASDDTALLERICAAYIKAVEQQPFAAEIYQSTEWWKEIRERSLGPVMRALQTCDVGALNRMYRNFFRDPCSTGLVGMPYGMSRAYSGGVAKDLHRRLYLVDVLYRIDCWVSETNGLFLLSDLAGPGIGNPFGVEIEGTLVTTKAAYQHYCAKRIGKELGPKRNLVAEIGGGFGAMAYYLLRDRADLTYLDFDVPESIALTSYYLLKAFPKLNFLLYGEKDLTNEALARADVVLMPLFEMEKMPVKSVDVTFSSHAISDISREAMGRYLEIIGRMTRSRFLCIGNSQRATTISEVAGERDDLFQPIEMRPSGWHSHSYSTESEVECLYRVGDILDAPQKERHGGLAACR